jgi:hypothetical protein
MFVDFIAGDALHVAAVVAVVDDAVCSVLQVD